MNIRARPLAEKLGLLLIGLMWVLPFLSPRHRLPIPSFYGELTAFVLGMAAICTLWQKQVWQDFQLPRIALLPLGLLGILLLQIALGMTVFPQLALIGMQYLLWACLLMVLGYRLCGILGRPELAATLSWFLVAGGIVNAVMAALQYAGVGNPWLLPKMTVQSFGNLGQPNHFADYMALATGSLLYLRANQSLPRLAFAALATAFLATLALSGSRSGWLYLAAFFILAAIRQRRHPSGENRRLLSACLMLLPAFAVIQAAMHWLLPLLGGTPHLLPTEHLFQQVSGASVRRRLWCDAVQMFIAHPWLGVGYGRFAWHSFLLAGTHAAGEFSQPAEHAHNLPLHLLAELGISAGVLLLACAWAWIKGATPQKSSLEHWWMWGLLAVLGIHSLLEYPLWYSYFLGIAAVLLGAGETRTLHPDFSRIGRPALAAMLGLGLYGAVGMAQSYASLEHWVNRAVTHRIADSALSTVNQELLRLHRESMLAPYVELMYAMALTPRRDQLDMQLTLTGSAIRFGPIPEVAHRHAILLAMRGHRELAQKYLDLTMKAYPENPPPQLRKQLSDAGLIIAR